MLWALHKDGSILTCSVRVTPHGLELSEALNGKRPHTRFTAQTEEELYAWAEKFRQSSLKGGWAPRHA